MNKLIAAVMAAIMAIFTCVSYPQMLSEAVSSQLIEQSGANVGESGQCGVNAYYELSGGKLTITGTGNMTPWDMASDTPWYKSRSSISSVVIGDGITNIGPGAFAECTNLRSISIPKTVTSISRGAFLRCSGLSSLDLS